MTEQSNKCAHLACDCQAEEGSKFCGEYCAEAERTGVLEIGCGCAHKPCHG